MWTISGGASFVGSTSETSVTVKFTGKTSSSVSITAKAKNACSSSVAASTTVAVGLHCREILTQNNSVIKSIDFATYLNPVNYKLNIAFGSAANERYMIKLVDIIGEIYVNEVWTAHEGNNLKELDLSVTPTGIYFLIIENEGSETKTIKLVVE